jgi:hypothetical protein
LAQCSRRGPTEGALERRQAAVGLVHRVAHPRRKSVATWSLRERAVLQPPRRRADQFGEAVLDMHVDVLERHILGTPPASYSSAIRSSPSSIASVSSWLTIAAGAEHRDMRPRRLDILAPQPLVEGDGGIYLTHECRGSLGKAPTPHLVGVLILAARDRLSPRPRPRLRTGGMR